MAENRTTENPEWNNSRDDNARARNQQKGDQQRREEGPPSGSGRQEGRDEPSSQRPVERSPWLGGG